MTNTHRVGFIGTGRMATSLAAGLRSAGLVDASSLFGTDVVAAAAAEFQKQTDGQIVDSVADLAAKSDVVFLSVKPQHMGGVLDGLSDSLTDSHLVVSIAAGVPLQTMTTHLGEQRRLVRVMPNTPCLVSAGASAFAMGTSATREDAELVKSLLETVGIAVEVPESLLDAVTGLSGSGPAYVYQIIEALSDGGVRMGLPRQVATQLAAQTLLGAAQMVLETGEHPGALKDAVTSPGGTTITGLHALERGGVRASLMNAVEAATKRSQELGST
ncbi:pyrroline-5-carboxylate reductase [Thalassoroseus pseudoceratinae]|uniref:pyrroline-5-carboxylate reductase n=1 Tax=Thalassoroseus pseudoceratinae TaxID=2713176 RepID=UPI0014244D44|nr:pyrroline-5-carboxylate reductase [Thalassoroseus pseudoceratinae]